MISKLAMIGVVSCALIAAAMVSGAETSSYQVAGHRFDIPKDHLFDSSIAWLPRPSAESFTFLFEPAKNPDQIPTHRVLVQDLAAHCPGGASQLLRLACGSEKTDIGDGPPYVRGPGSIPALFNLYAVEKSDAGNSKSEKRQVAYCQVFEPNPVQPKSRNICTTFWAHDGLSLQFSFDERDAPQMPAMKKRAVELLDSWKAR